jgi:putative FmdB family regulatory protein
MPIYEYECNACGDRHEFIQKFSDAAKRKCPSCGKPRLRKLVSAAAFHLKGSGWYVTDFRDKDKKKVAKDDKPGAKSDTAAETASESKADAKPDAKPEAKTDAKPQTKAGKKKGDGAPAST